MTSRRKFLRSAALAGTALPLGAVSWAAAKGSIPATTTALKIAWLPAAVCVAPVPIALSKGFFAKYNLDVQLVDFAFHTREMLESPGNGTTDAGVTMIHNWLMAAQQGVQVRLITGVHGGCVRIVGSRSAGVTDAEALRGKSIGIAAEPGELAKVVFSIILTNNGLDPARDVTWVQVPGKELAQAIRSGKIAAAAELDPPLRIIQNENPDLVEVLTNQSGPMQNRICCAVAAGEHLWKGKPRAAAALVLALNEASEYARSHPEEAASAFAARSPFKQENIVESLKAMDFHAHHQNADLRLNIQQYANDLKAIGTFPADFDVAAFVRRTYAPVAL